MLQWLQKLNSNQIRIAKDKPKDLQIKTTAFMAKFFKMIS